MCVGEQLEGLGYPITPERALDVEDDIAPTVGQFEDEPASIGLVDRLHKKIERDKPPKAARGCRRRAPEDADYLACRCRARMMNSQKSHKISIGKRRMRKKPLEFPQSRKPSDQPLALAHAPSLAAANTHPNARVRQLAQV